MAAHTYVTKGYSTYTDLPSQQGGYDHGPKKPVNRYVIETTTIERVRTPAAGYTNYGGSPSKIELLKEYVHAPSSLTGPKYAPNDHYEGHEPKPKYAPNNHYEGHKPKPKYAPKDHYEGYEPNYRPVYENSSSPHYYGREDHLDNLHKKVQTEASRPIKTSNFSSPNTYDPSRPVHGYPREETHLTRTGSFSSPNKYHPSSAGSEGARHVRTGNFSGHNNSWQSAGPPVTHHPLTTSTNDINEALGFLEESINHSPHSDPRGRGGALDGLPTRAQPIEPERRYTRPTFAGATTQPHYKNTGSGSTIDSKEAMKRYGGSLVP